MSKNIIIQEGGAGKQLTVDKLKTDLAGGGSCLWVPEDGTTLGTKYINADGTYKASNDGLYGYSEVTVRGTGKATGKDSDGDEAYAYTDPITGRLVTDKLPSSLVVEVNPSKMTYFDGETLDFTGMVVKAYLATGGLWTNSSHPNGVIPVSELVFPITQADYSKVRSDEYSDGHGVNALLISYLPHWDLDWKGQDYLVYADITKAVGYKEDDAVYLSGAGTADLYVTRYNGKVYAYRIQGDDGFNYTKYDSSRETSRYYGGGVTTYKTTEGQWELATWHERMTEMPESTSDPLSAGPLSPIDAYQEIPIQWTRPNGDVLETSFRIAVVPSNQNGGE